MLLVALAVYWPALRGGFIWDDEAHITRIDLRSLGGLYRIWFEPGATQQYYPLLHSAFWLEHKLWGDSVLGYHFVNILLHATAAGLFALVLRRLFDHVGPSTGLRAFDSHSVAAGHERRRYAGVEWFAAWLFLLHPVCVESVAWISEQKNTLSLVLYLAAALAWLRFDRSRRPVDYAVAGGVFVLALLTKTVTATLPAALLVVAWWQRGRLEWRRDVQPLLPWFVLGAAGGLLTAYFERKLIGAEGADFALGFLERGLLAGRVVWFYAGKLLWPVNLTFIYPRWGVDAAVWWQWLFPLAGLGLLAVLFRWRTRSRGPLAAALLFGGSLFPVLGFFNVFPFLYSYVADHFQYLASLAAFALAGAGLSRLPGRTGLAATLGLAAVFATLSWRQAGMYRDVFTLYETTLRRNPACWMAHNNLAIVLAGAGRGEEAVFHLESALKLRPDYAEASSNLGSNLNKLGRPAEAIPHLERAIHLKPAYAEAHNNLGAALMALDRNVAGQQAFLEATRLKPDFAEAHRNLALTIAMGEHTADALPHFMRAAQLNPHDPETEAQWGVALSLLGRLPEAIPHFEKAATLAPGSAEIRNAHGRALARHDRPADALAQFEAALKLNPRFADAHYNAALALRQLGRMPEANRHYQEAVRLNPGLAR
jgi:tetratricopeptide (TPR) repeat protein